MTRAVARQRLTPTDAAVIATAGECNTHFTGHRFYDAANYAWMVKVLPGECYVTAKMDEILVTVLGSCVSACIRDPRTGMGGMNHFMLPNGQAGEWGDELHSMRYGNYAMEKLVNEVLKIGCARESMEIKVFGGGNVTDSSNAIGTQNSDFVLRYLKSEGLNCAAQDLGGKFPRRIQYSPATGRVVRRFLGGSDRDVVIREESEYASHLSKRKTSGEIQLFGEEE